jgi:sulfur-carrier protein adenylyltransferase/sulfurtransferase
MLARSGVRAFVLIDDDVFAPGNLVRHELDWTSMGEHKCDALARHLALVAPGTTCTVRRQHLGGQESSGLTDWSLTQLGQCDLIVDATASPRVLNLLASVSEVAKRPLVWAEVFGGGIGGLIARARPDLDPDPQALRARVNAWCAKKNAPVPRAGVDYDGLRDGVPLMADDADVSAIAAHAARMCIDALIARSPSWFPVSAYLIGLAQEWIFEQPFHTFPVDVGAPATPTPQQVPPDPAHVATIIQLMLNGRDEAPPSP